MNTTNTLHYEDIVRGWEAAQQRAPESLQPTAAIRQGKAWTQTPLTESTKKKLFYSQTQNEMANQNVEHGGQG